MRGCDNGSVPRSAAFPLAASLLFAALTLLPGSDGARAALLPAYGGEIRLPREPGPVDLDPLHASSPLSRTLVHALYDTLFRIGPDGAPAAHLALRYEAMEGGLLYRISLRPDVTFHDGTALTSREVKASLERMTVPGAPTSWMLSDVEGALEFLEGRATEVRGIAATSRNELEIRLARITSWLPQALCSPRSSIVRPMIPQGGTGSDRAAAGELLVGTGPFRYLRTDAEGTVVAEAFEEHFGGSPLFDGIRFVPVAGSREQQRALDIGSLDCALGDRVAREGAQPIGASVPIEGVTILVRISGKGPFGDASLRSALNLAVDRRTIAEILLRGEAEAAEAILPPDLSPYRGVLQPYPYDLARARTLRRTTDRLRAKMLVPAGFPVLKRIAERIQVNLLDIGVEVSIEEVDPNGIRQRGALSRADLSLEWWYPETADPLLALESLVADSSGVDGNRLLASLTPQLQMAAAATTATQTVLQILSVEQEMLAQAPWILLVHPRLSFACAPSITALGSDFGGVLRVEDAWRVPAAARE